MIFPLVDPSVVIVALPMLAVVMLAEPAPNCEIDALVTDSRVTVEDVKVKLSIVALVAVKFVTFQFVPLSVPIVPLVVVKFESVAEPLVSVVMSALAAPTFVTEILPPEIDTLFAS